jgi:hypothetical protein
MRRREFIGGSGARRHGRWWRTRNNSRCQSSASSVVQPFARYYTHSEAQILVRGDMAGARLGSAPMGSVP